MIEITAKQLYDIYKHLPPAGNYFENFGNEPYYFSIFREKPLNVELEDPIKMDDISFVVDVNQYPFQWKPTKDLIIKA